MKTLQQLIQEKNFDYVNSNITDTLFPIPTMEEEVEYDLVHLNKYISSEDAIKELSKDGWRPATLYDLLKYDWNGTDWVVALGSVAGVGGIRLVPCLFRRGSERRLNLSWFRGGWGSICRFLRVRTLPLKSSENQALGHSEILTLEKAIDFIKTLGWTITLTK
jgi:hypothetical protein